LSHLLSGTDTAARCTDDDGVVHEVWPIADVGSINALTAALGSSTVLIADGHHRFETALAYRDEIRRANKGVSGPYDLVMAFVVELSDEQLSVQAIHRLITGLPDGFDLRGALAREFDLTTVGTPGTPGAADGGIPEKMQSAGALALVDREGAWLLKPRPGAGARGPDEPDSELLDRALSALPRHDVEYQHGWNLAATAVQRGEAQAAVLLRPPSVERIARTARGGARMPPKTTFFWPKPRTGLVFREVAG
jgi:uncharacterized protein (DUF1015 family)